uniref:Uncharacterized protein n=1 Tax=Arundo donax TaxID=35708 RepID=A0A0A9C8T3_ARUDO
MARRSSTSSFLTIEAGSVGRRQIHGHCRRGADLLPPAHLVDHDDLIVVLL